MQLHDLTPQEGSTHRRKRIGRGNSSGHGTTAGRGQKGQLSRSGGGKGSGFEGGQTPLAMRLPKLPGFRNPRRIEFAPVNIARLDEKFEDGAVIDGAALDGAPDAPLIVTPREIDLLLRRAAHTLGVAINLALQPTLTLPEITQLMA